MPTDTAAAEPHLLVHYATTTAPAAARLVGHAGEVGGAARPHDHQLGDDLARHARQAAELARETAAVGVAFAVAGGAAGLLALARPLRGLDDEEVASLVAAALGLPRHGGEVAPSATDPDDVAALAAMLTPVQLARLAAGHPLLVGPVDGMPVGARFAANRVLAARAAEVADRLGDAGRAAALRRLLAPGRQILFVDPAGDGRAAEVFGDLDTARNIAVVVPGMGNSLANFEHGTVEKGRAVADAAGEGTAVVAWLGYDSPLADVLLDDGALDGATHLVRLLDAMPEAARRTVVSHSYGTVVTAAALQRGLEVDQVVVTGSPGMLAASATDLAGATPIWAGRAPLDYVGWSQAYGRDPSDARFGATRFDTGDEVVGHGGYFDPGTESLANIARIVRGDLDAVSVVEPGIVEGLVHVVDGLDARADRHVDVVQDRFRDAAGLVGWAVDRVQPVLPDPVESVVDGVQRGAGDVLELTSRATDVVQRLASPDLVGDVALDSWAYARDHADDLLDLLPG